MIQGKTLSHPIQPDVRGTLGTISRKGEIVEQSIIAFVETRQGERVMLPDYGIPDFCFEVMDAGFTARIAYFVERVRFYEPLIEKIKAFAGFFADEQFVPGFTEDQQIAAVAVEYIERGQNTPRNLVFPTWQLRGA